MLIEVVNRYPLIAIRWVLTPRITIGGKRLTKTWHFRRDWLFTPFVVVVGCKYFLPVPECLLFDWE
jgi:hypothetical protein